MKNAKLFSYLLIVASTSFFARCTPERLDDFGTAKEIISNGQWSVDYYYAGQDKTTQFSNYQFSFIGNGTVTANYGTGSINGTWAILRDVNRNEVLRISIQEPHLQELNEQWNVVNASSDILGMKGSNSELRLKKL
jgi:hypothetical protein